MKVTNEADKAAGSVSCHAHANCEFCDQLERDLAFATDAANKGDLARANVGGMEMRINELQRDLAAARAEATRWKAGFAEAKRLVDEHCARLGEQP